MLPQVAHRPTHTHTDSETMREWPTELRHRHCLLCLALIYMPPRKLWSRARLVIKPNKTGTRFIHAPPEPQQQPQPQLGPRTEEGQKAWMRKLLLLGNFQMNCV